MSARKPLYLLSKTGNLGGLCLPRFNVGSGNLNSDVWVWTSYLAMEQSSSLFFLILISGSQTQVIFQTLYAELLITNAQIHWFVFFLFVNYPFALYSHYNPSIHPSLTMQPCSSWEFCLREFIHLTSQLLLFCCSWAKEYLGKITWTIISILNCP